MFGYPVEIVSIEDVSRAIVSKLLILMNIIPKVFELHECGFLRYRYELMV